MKFLDIQSAVGTAVLLWALPSDAKHGRGLSHMETFGKRHQHQKLHLSPRVENLETTLATRGGSCQFPSDAGLFAVTPGSKNAGWAMSPDQKCEPGSYCPYACPSGQVMAQWDPTATSYTYPGSMNGGLYCDKSGSVSKPFPNKPYCVDGSGAIGVKNNAGSGVAFCQTVLPGNEAMLIPTHVTSYEQLAVPNPSYWCSTAAHYYINPPGVSASDGCVWGDETKPIGNWAPYVAGANTDSNGNTFIKIGWNPIWTGCSLSKTLPTFGIKIVCSGSGCNGTPCSIDPSVNGAGGVTSSDQATGAGGASFCVVTVPKGQSANVEVFSVGGGGSSGSSSKSASSSAKPSPTSTRESQTPTPTPTPSSTSSTQAPSSTSTSTTEKPSSTSSSSSSSSSSASSSSEQSIKALEVSSESSSESPSSSSASATSTSSSSQKASTTPYPTASNLHHILFENVTSSQTMAIQASATGNAAGVTNVTSVSTSQPTAAATTKKSAGDMNFVSGSTIIFGAIFALASAYFL